LRKLKFLISLTETYFLDESKFMLKVENLSVIYDNGLKALEKVNLEIATQGICGIIGPNGGGKTTFIKALLGLVPAKGKVSFKGKPIKTYAKKTSYIEQKNALDLDFPINALQCVLLGTYPSLGFFRRPGNIEKTQAREAIKKVGLAGLENRQIGELSGGQLQRVLIARSIVQDADLIFLDEPFTGVDVNSEIIIIDLLKELAEQGKSIFMVHHDLGKVKSYFNRIILINKKIIAYGKTEEVFNKENLQKTFDVLDHPLLMN